jgi:hypothetical protein
MPPLNPGFNFIGLQLQDGTIPDPVAAGAVNNNSVVVGTYFVGDHKYGFVWDVANNQDPIVGLDCNLADRTSLETKNGIDTSVDSYWGIELLDINDNDVIVGRLDYGTATPIAHSFAFIVKRSAAIPNALPGAFDILMMDSKPPVDNTKDYHAHGINNDNKVVGIYKDYRLMTMSGKAATRGFLYTPPNADPSWSGKETDFKTINPPNADDASSVSQVFGINDAGVLVGACDEFPYWWPDESWDAQKVTLVPTTLPPPPWGYLPTPVTNSPAKGHSHRINNAQQIVGEAQLPEELVVDPRQLDTKIGWEVSADADSGTTWPMTLIQAPYRAWFGNLPHLAPCSETVVLGLNDKGWLVGSCTPVFGGRTYGFVYVPSPIPLDKPFEAAVFDPNWWFPPGPYTEIHANLQISLTAAAIADPKQRRELQRLALKGAEQQIRGLLNRLKEK